MFLAMLGGWMATITTGLGNASDFYSGLLLTFKVYDVMYALIKTVVFAFIISSISGFHGYTMKGGALEVGNASTKAVVFSSIAIILFNLILTQLLLA
jgi:phospholipid/cholesterol/gamma-HCH transport system permease protein